MSTEQKAESIADNYVKVLRFLKERYPHIIKEIGLGNQPNPDDNADTNPSFAKQGDDRIS